MRVRPRVSVEAEASVAAGPHTYSEVADRFKKIDALGSGFFSTVYDAVDQESGKRCALKVMQKSPAEGSALLKEECEALELVNKKSGAAPALYECGKDYIVMELIKGTPLYTWANREKDAQEIKEALNVLADLIDSIHAAGVEHGDLHSKNVVVTAEGLMAVDFGLSTINGVENWDAISETVRVLTRAFSLSLEAKAAGKPDDIRNEIHNYTLDETSDLDSSDRIRRIAKGIDEILQKAKEDVAEPVTESVMYSLRKLSESYLGHHLEVRNNALVVPVENPNIAPPEPNIKTRGEYHITIVSPPELSSAIKNGTWSSMEVVSDLAKDWKITGDAKYVCVGKQEKGDNATYFIVVDWPEAQEFRKEQFFLNKRDLHITLGFRQSDIHDVPKDASTCIQDLQEMEDPYRAGPCPVCGKFAVETFRHHGAPVQCGNGHYWRGTCGHPEHPNTVVPGKSESLTERVLHQELPIDIPDPVIKVLKDIKKEGGKGVLIGGSVRDALLGKKAKDIDVEVYGVPGDKLAEILGRHGKVNLVGKQFGVYKSRLSGVDFDIDFSLPRREYKVTTGHKGFDVKPDPSMDYVSAAKRRDFTINTIGYDPLEKIVYDPHGGIEALKKGVIKMTDPQAFKDDPLRVLRMAQFASRFGFDVDPETMQHAKDAPELETLPSERILEEFKKALLRAKRPSIFLDQLEKAGTVERIFPEIKGSLDALKKNVDAAAEKRSGNEDDDFVLMLSAMASVLPWNVALKFIGRFVRETDVKERVQNIYNAIEMAKSSFPATDSEIRHWLSTIKKKNFGVLRGLMPIEFGSKADELLRKAEEMLPSIDPIVMGRDLQDLGVAPGPMMGRLLKQLYHKQLDGEFKDLEGGKEVAKEIMASATTESVPSPIDKLLEIAEQVVTADPDVIVVDVDGTLVDVSARAVQSFKDMGVEVSADNWEGELKKIKGPQKGQFFKSFLSDKYTDLDVPYPNVINFVKKMSDETNLPVVILTGRPSHMKHTQTVASMLAEKGIPIKDVLSRGRSEGFMKTPQLKVSSLKTNGYKVHFALDDEPRILDAIGSEWPEARLYRADRGTLTPYSPPFQKNESNLLV
jgi:tRNA nucleotidyltransferase (CCA-adding enzyme)